MSSGVSKKNSEMWKEEPESKSEGEGLKCAPLQLVSLDHQLLIATLLR